MARGVHALLPAHRGRGGQLLQCQPRGPARMGGTHVCPFKILSWLDGMHSFSKRLGQHANTAMPTLRTGESWDQRMSGHSRSCLGWMVCTDPARGLVKVRTLQCRPRGPGEIGRYACLARQARVRVLFSLPCRVLEIHLAKVCPPSHSSTASSEKWQGGGHGNWRACPVNPFGSQPVHKPNRSNSAGQAVPR